MNLSQLHPLIVMVTVIDIVFFVAGAAINATHLIVILVPISNVIPLALLVPALTIEKGMSTGGCRQGFVSVLSPILA